MYMNLKSNKHKIISFNTTTMASSAFIGPAKISGPPLNLAPPTPNYIFCSAPPRPQLFWPEIFRSPLKIRGGGCYHVKLCTNFELFHQKIDKLKTIFKTNGHPKSLADLCIKKYLDNVFIKKEVVRITSKMELISFLPFN